MTPESSIARIEAIKDLGDPRLTPQQAQIVEVLYDNPGHILTVEDIEAALPAGRRNGETWVMNLIKVQISKARYRLPANAIQTVRLHGYRLGDGFRLQMDLALAGVS